jgi:hypothetical protein
MLCLITYRRLAQCILLLHRYLLLYHPSVLPSLHEFLFNVQNIKYTQSLFHCTVRKISFPTSLYFPKSDSGQESYVCFTSVMKSVLKFQNAQCSMFSPKLLARVSKHVGSCCVGMVTWWSFWKSHFLHFYTSEQALKLMKTEASVAGFGGVDDLSCNSFRHDFFFNYSSFVYMVGENRAFSRHVPFLRSLAWPSAKHDRDLQNLL